MSRDFTKNLIRKYGTVFVAMLVFIFFSVATKGFFTTKNVMLLLKQMSALTIISLGFTFVMAVGGFDMSVGYATGLVGIIFIKVLIGEFSHGMHRSIDSGSSVLLIKSCDCMKDQIEQSYQYLKGVTDRVWMIDATGEGSNDETRLCVPSFPGAQSVLLTTLAIQVISVYAPEYNGKDPNRDAHNDFTVVAGTRL